MECSPITNLPLSTKIVALSIATLFAISMTEPLTAIILQLLSKLEGLNVKEINFEIYRKTIFECISLVRSI